MVPPIKFKKLTRENELPGVNLMCVLFGIS